MKRFGIIAFSAISIIAAAVSCNKQEFEKENTNGNSVNITVTTAPLTKTNISQDETDPTLYHPNWDGTEKMGIWVDDIPTSGSAQPDFLNNTVAGKIAAFTGSISSLTAGSHTLYGYASAAEKYVNSYYQDGSIGFEVPQVQNPSLNSFDPKADLLIAQAKTIEIAEGQSEITVNDVKFARPLAVLKVVLKDASTKGLKDNAVLTSLTLAPADVASEPLTGRAKINIKTGSSIERFNTTSNVVAKYADGAFVINDINGVWLIVNPLTFGETSTLELTAEAGKYTIKKTLNVGGKSLKGGDVTIFNVSLTDDDITVVESGVALPFADDFSEASSGSISAPNTAWTESTNFNITGKVYQAGGAIRLGSSEPGSIETKNALDLSQPFTVKVTGTGYDSDEHTLTVTAGSQSQDITFTSDKSGGKYELQYLHFEAESNLCKVSFAAQGEKRALIDEVEIVSGKWIPTPELQSATTNNATALISATGTTATLNGAYTAMFLGETDVVTYGFEWGTDASSLTSVTASDAVDGVFSYDLTGLTADTEYTFQAWAALNNGEKVYGEALTFKPEVKVSGETKTVTMETFTAVNDAMDEVISYATAKNNGTAGPTINSGVIRLYQSSNKNGGSITITAAAGYKITSITIGSSMGTTIGYTIDNASIVSDNALAANAKFDLPDINATSVEFKCEGSTSKTRLYVNYLSVTYVSE